MQRIELERKEKEATIEALRAEIEIMLREEYETRWHQAMAVQEENFRINSKEAKDLLSSREEEDTSSRKNDDKEG